MQAATLVSDDGATTGFDPDAASAAELSRLFADAQCLSRFGDAKDGSFLESSAKIDLDLGWGTLTSVTSFTDVDSGNDQDLDQTLEDIAQAARSLKILLEYLEQHPDALIKGKGKGGN